MLSRTVVLPIRLHNSEICPMLMEKSALEKARKKLQEKELITFTASRSLRKLPTYYITGCVTEKCGIERYTTEGSATDGCESGGCVATTINQKPRPSKTIAERLAAKNENTMIAALERMWSAFDERALNANEVTMFAYLLHEVERNQWQMPFRCKDYMVLTLLLKQSSLNDARNELAVRNLITFDIGDGKRDVPQYTIVGVGNNAPVKNGKSATTHIGTQGEAPNKTNVGTLAENKEEIPEEIPQENSHEVHRWSGATESNVSSSPQANTLGKSSNKPYGTDSKPQPKDKLNLNGNRWNKSNGSYQG